MTWLWVTIAIVADGLAGLAGALVPERWLASYRAPMLGFATGALLASATTDILPDAIARGGAWIVAWSAGAFAALGVIEWASSRRAKHQGPVSPIALLGSDALHNIGDGMAIAAAFLTSHRLGVITALAVIVHEVPEEIADYALLRSSGMPKARALLGLGVVQLTAGLGAAGTLLASALLAHAEGVILAIAAGTFLYIALADLLPVLWRARTWSAAVTAVIGAALVIALP
jgi:zinc transporter ZupT